MQQRQSVSRWRELIGQMRYPADASPNAKGPFIAGSPPSEEGASCTGADAGNRRSVIDSDAVALPGAEFPRFWTDGQNTFQAEELATRALKHLFHWSYDELHRQVRAHFV